MGKGTWHWAGTPGKLASQDIFCTLHTDGIKAYRGGGLIDSLQLIATVFCPTVLPWGHSWFVLLLLAIKAYSQRVPGLNFLNIRHTLINYGVVVCVLWCAQRQQVVMCCYALLPVVCSPRESRFGSAGNFINCLDKGIF